MQLLFSFIVVLRRINVLNVCQNMWYKFSLTSRAELGFYKNMSFLYEKPFHEKATKESHIQTALSF